MTVIDSFPKEPWAEAVKINCCKCDRSNEILFNKNKLKPKNLQMKAILAINFYATYYVLKRSIVERFNITLKAMMWKEFSHQGTYKRINIYQDLVGRYNNILHRTIKMAPNEVNLTNERDLHHTVFNNLKVFITLFIGFKLMKTKYPQTYLVEKVKKKEGNINFFARNYRILLNGRLSA